MNTSHQQNFFINILRNVYDYKQILLNASLPYIFPVSYVALILSGLLKGWVEGNTFNFKVDLTILFFFTSLFSFVLLEISPSIIFERLNGRSFLTPMFFLMSFLLWYNLTFLWSLSTDYYIKKMQNFFLLVSIFTLPLLCKNDFVEKFTKIFILFSLTLTIIFFYNYVYNFPFYLRSASLVYAYIIGGVSLFLITSKFGLFVNYLRLLLIPLCNLMFLLFGARSPLLFFTLTTGAWLIFNFKKENIVYILTLFFLTGSSFFIFKQYLDPTSEKFNNTTASRSIEKFEGLLNVNEVSSIDLNAPLSSIENKEEGMGSSVNYRLVQYYRSIGYILSDPLKFFIGWGIGSYGILENGIDERNYPHNCILEIFIESGLIGFVLFTIMITCFLYYSYKTNLLRKYLFFGLIFIYYCGFFLTSSSIAEARIPFALLGLLLLLGERAQNKDPLSTIESRKNYGRYI